MLLSILLKWENVYTEAQSVEKNDQISRTGSIPMVGNEIPLRNSIMSSR
jgi:hypothetical protein